MKNKFIEDTYIPQAKRKTILLLSDDLRMSSGIGTVSREIVLNTAQHFNWIQVGAAIEHPDRGKIFDISNEINNYLGINDSKVIIYPNNGYGDQFMINQLMTMHKIDGIMPYTDPRFFIWLFQIEHEIRQKVPLFYYNVWDELPYPIYNKHFYDVCDGLFAISKQTLNINREVLGKNNYEELKGKERFSNETLLSYIPHGINNEIFFPIDAEKHPEHFARLSEVKNQLFGESKPEFVVLFNNRNIRRKLVTNVIVAFDKFVSELPEDKRDKVILLLHTAPVDDNGTDLPTFVNALTKNKNIIFSQARVEPRDMNCLYNLADCTISLSNAEGFGLATAESLMTGKPIIATVTGGLQDQMRFEDENGNWIDFSAEFPSNHNGKYKKCGEWALPLFPDALSFTGSPLTPYIEESFVHWEKATEALHLMYSFGPEERNRRGLKGREWMLSEESGMSAYHMAEKFVLGMDAVFNNWIPRKRFSMYNSATFEYLVKPEHSGILYKQN